MESTRCINYYSSGHVREIHYYSIDKDGFHIYHREDGPVWITYDPSNCIRCVQWLQHGRLHRLDGPAYTTYYSDMVESSNSYYINGDEISPEDYVFTVKLGYQLKRGKDRNLALLNIKHEYKYIREICENILSEKNIIFLT